MPRSVRMRSCPTSWPSKNGITRSLSSSAAQIGVFRSYSLAEASFEKVSTKVCC